MPLKLAQMPDTDVSLPSSGIPDGMHNPPVRDPADTGNNKKQAEEKPKRRKRRTRAEIEADKAREAAEKSATKTTNSAEGQDNSPDKTTTGLTDEQLEAALSGVNQENPPWEAPAEENQFRACRDKASFVYDFGWCKVYELSSLDRQLVHEDEHFMIFKKI